MKELFTALINAQKEIGSAVKGSANPFFKSKYADYGAVLETVKDSLLKHGLFVIQEIEGLAVKTVLIHESGQSRESFCPIVCAKEKDPQAFGSAVTYARRYALQSLLCIPTMDDDGESNYSRNEPKKDVPTDPGKDEKASLIAQIGDVVKMGKLLPEEIDALRKAAKIATPDRLRQLLTNARIQSGLPASEQLL